VSNQNQRVCANSVTLAIQRVGDGDCVSNSNPASISLCTTISAAWTGSRISAGRSRSGWRESPRA